MTNQTNTDSSRSRFAVPTINGEFAARVGRKARAQYARGAWPRPGERAVPALLLVSGVFYTAVAIERMVGIFGS